jgi:hypothetical protein
MFDQTKLVIIDRIEWNSDDIETSQAPASTSATGGALRRPSVAVPATKTDFFSLVF